MKNTLRQIFHSSKFVAGFVIFVAIILLIIIYPLVNPGNPLEMIGVGTFAKPGNYVSVYDAVTTQTETLKLPDAAAKRLGSVLKDKGGKVSFDEIGLPVKSSGMTLPCGSTAIWETE